MSTPCKITINSSYSTGQCLSEIRWIEHKMEEVREEMKRRPSKWRHLKDLERQRQDHLDILERSLEG